MNIENADNSDKNHRSYKLNTVETKMKSLGIPIMAHLNPNQTLIRFKPSGSIMKKNVRLRTLYKMLEIKCWKLCVNEKI